MFKGIERLFIFRSDINSHFLDSFDFAKLKALSFDEHEKLGTTNKIYNKLWKAMGLVLTMGTLRINIQHRYYDYMKLFKNLFTRQNVHINQGQLILKSYGSSLDLQSFLIDSLPLNVFDNLILDVGSILIR